MIQLPGEGGFTMKRFTLPLLFAFVALPMIALAQEIVVVPIGNIPSIPDKGQTVWGLGGYEMITVRAGVGGSTPIMRSETMDARTVEILSRTQAPPLRPSDVKHISRSGHEYVVVRNFLLMEVMPEDAAAEHDSKSIVAKRWAAAVGKVLPRVGPTPSRFGI